MTRWVLVMVACGTGCRGLLGIDDPVELAGDGGVHDGVSDGPIITDGSTSDGTFASCFGASLVHVCLPTPPSGAVTLTGSINTDGAGACTITDHPGLCVIAGNSILLDNLQVLPVFGSRPLVLIATGSITINGRLDAESYPNLPPGPGARSSCPGATPPMMRGGGAGGSFGGRGGDGGMGPGPGGIAAAIPAITELTGGCPGTAGNGPAPGAAGVGGGAVYLIGGSITIGSAALIGAWGASGGGGGNNSGGGGGGAGSGGFVGLEAPTITVDGAIDADGSGGGEGGSNSKGVAGSEPISTGMSASGGAGANANGGDGGAGSGGAASAGFSGFPGSASGGGGGGGTGIVWVHGALTGGTISPAPTQH